MSSNKPVVPANLATAIKRSVIVFAAILSSNQTALAQQTLDFYDDGMDVNRINQLSGALEIVSPIGMPNSGAAGADVNAILINPGRYQVGVGANADASVIDFYANGGAANPWAAGILAASFGAEGVDQGETRSPDLINGGGGGTVTVDTTSFSSASATQITLSGYGAPELTGQLTLAGVYALSQGGQNSLALDKRGINAGTYSNGGNGWRVNVDFLGLIRDEGSFDSSAGPLISNAIGISAISRGGVFKCWEYDCTGNNYPDGVYNKPGAGGDVSVTLHVGSDITLDSGSAIGIYAASMNGAILGTDSGDPFNVNTSTQSAGTVTITVQEGANIAVGGGSALEAYGVFGLSAGSELQVPLQYQTDSKSLVNLGGAAFGGDVTVDNAGTVSATGVLAIGVAGMNVGGQAAVGLLGIEQAGVYEPNKNRDRYQLTPQVLGDVSVSNSGTINVNGETSFGLLAVSMGRGFVFHNPSDWLTTDLLDPQADFDGDGLVNAVDTDDDNDGVSDWDDSDDNNNGIPDYPCTASTTPGDFPTCNGSESGLVLGNTDSGTSTSAGDVYAQNSGTITNGVDGEEGNYAYGMLALSVGGGGATGSGGLGVFAGDSGGAGGHGGAVAVKNSGDITTYGNHSQAVVAASVGGGGGAGGSVGMTFVSIGGDGGSGGDGGEVDVSLTGAGTITTDGALSEGVLAQSIGGGGGIGGAGKATARELTIGIGGSGGDGGNGESVNVAASENDDPVAESFTVLPAFAKNVAASANDDPLVERITGLPVFANPDLSGFEIITTGKQASGVLAQSIGGGGGAGGSATSDGRDFVFGFNLDIGGSGGSGGNASGATVTSIFDIYVEGDNSRGITAQSIGGGGGLGGDASGNIVNIEVPTEAIPNLFANIAVGGKGGAGGSAGTVDISNGGVIVTDGEAAIGILGQSIAGGGGDAGAQSTWNKFANIPVPAEGWGIQTSVAVGRSGGDGGDASAVTVSNGYNGDLEGVGYVAGTVLTYGTHSAGLVAQSIGGGGGVGGSGDVSSGKSFWYDVATALVPLFVDAPFANINVDVSVGGSGGAGGNGGDVYLINGIEDKDLGGYQGGTVVTLGGSAHGLVAQSVGGGGGLAPGGALHNTGGKLNFGLALGGSGGAAGNGGNVSVLNPTGSVILTGGVYVEESTEEEMSAGLSPYTMITLGGGSVGILAQSIGGGGGAGGNADAASSLPDKHADIRLGMAYFKRALEFLPKAGDPKPWWKKLEVNMNVSIAGSGGAAGVGGDVDVTNDGIIGSFGNQAFGIHAQSIGGGGGSGGSVEAEPVNWQTYAAAPAEFSRLGFGATVGGNGGEGNHGGAVTVDHQANGLIITYGHGASGIFAQSVGGGGGHAGVAAVNSEGFAYLGFTKQGDAGPGGAGDAVSVTSAGTITTVGDDSNGVLAQSIGGGGGVVTAGCTNSDVPLFSFDNTNPLLVPIPGFNAKAQSPCWGNSGSEDGVVANETTTSETSDSEESNRGAMFSFAIQMGGKDGTSDHGMDGGSVDIEVSDLIATHGRRSLGVVAQSIGGGGGYVSQDATAFGETAVGAGAGVNHSHGGAITVNLSGQASIKTLGSGAWGILAQSIGGSGGFAGDSSLNLGGLASNTVENVCCGEFSSGSDGGTIDITLAQGTEISTYGTNAHGIVAQSIGGGGGIALGGGSDPNGLLYMGNTRSPEWIEEWDDEGLPDITMTGQGGAITIDIAQDAAVGVYGNGSVGILAQSSGNSGYQSPITINVDGSVFSTSRTTNDAGNANAEDLATAAGSTGFTCGGCLNGSAILISGGTSGLEGGNGHGNDPNLITVGSTGHVQVADLDFSAIYSTYGYTNVKIYGEVYGGIVLGDSISDPTLAGNLGAVIVDGGHWTLGTWNVVDDEHSIYDAGVYNAGVITVSSAPTVIMGSLQQSEVGEMRFNLDPVIHSAEYALTISGLAQIDGTITPVVQTLLPGDLRVLTAGKLEGSPNVVDPLLFDWHLDMANGSELSLSAIADFQPSGIDLTHNAGAAAQYLTRIWDSGDATLGAHFAYMLALETEDQYSSMLSTLSEPEVLQHDVAALRAMPAFMGDVIDCADASGAQVQGDKANCVWLQADMSSGRYDGSDTERTDIDSTLFAIGMQREIQPGWYLGGAFGRNRSDIKAASFRGDGHTDMLAVGLRHEAGDWSMGASLAYGNGSFDSMRSFALPGIVGASAADNATMSSASGLDVIALQAQASYRFEWDNVYLRPELSLAVSNVERDAFEEESMVGDHLFLLQAASDSSTLYWVTPHVELGGQWQVGEGTQLKAYVDAGVRVAPWDSEIDLRFAGVNEDTGWFRNSIDDPLSAAMLKAGVELFSDESLALKLEYGLEDNGDYQIQTGSARVDWNF